MKFKLEIKMDNAAFEAMNGNAVAEMLSKLGMGIRGLELAKGDSGPFFDSNGNKVGRWEVK